MPILFTVNSIVYLLGLFLYVQNCPRVVPLNGFADIDHTSF